jgi:hypothetical protein
MLRLGRNVRVVVEPGLHGFCSSVLAADVILAILGCERVAGQVVIPRLLPLSLVVAVLHTRCKALKKVGGCSSN